MRIPFKSFEKVTLKISCEKAFVLRTIVSLRQSQIVSIKSGAVPSEASKFPSGLLKKKKQFIVTKSFQFNNKNYSKSK